MSASPSPVTCNICFRGCRIPEGKTGWCKTKKNEKGTIQDLSAGNITALALDPIEKKPLKRFYPGSQILTAGSYGCALRCPFCQNWEISQQDLQDESTSVDARFLVQKAKEYAPYGCVGIALSYNEPALNPDFVREAFQLAREAGLKTVLVTSGCSPVPVLETYLPWTDAFNIDLKGWSQDFYDWVQGDLETTKAYIQRAAQSAHVELTFLVIPGKNDDERDFEAMVKWIARIRPDIPLHITRSFPRYQWKGEPTPITTLIRLKEIAERHLEHVYLGNV